MNTRLLLVSTGNIANATKYHGAGVYGYSQLCQRARVYDHVGDEDGSSAGDEDFDGDDEGEGGAVSSGGAGV